MYIGVIDQGSVVKSNCVIDWDYLLPCRSTDTLWNQPPRNRLSGS